MGMEDTEIQQTHRNLLASSRTSSLPCLLFTTMVRKTM